MRRILLHTHSMKHRKRTIAPLKFGTALLLFLFTVARTEHRTLGRRPLVHHFTDIPGPNLLSAPAEHQRI